MCIEFFYSYLLGVFHIQILALEFLSACSYDWAHDCINQLPGTHAHKQHTHTHHTHTHTEAPETGVVVGTGVVVSGMGVVVVVVGFVELIAGPEVVESMCMYMCVCVQSWITIKESPH